jgi:hypothetical protein
MTNVHGIPLESDGEWRQALAGIPHGFAHTWENCHAMWLTTGHRTVLYCLQTDQARIVCPISERKFCDAVDIYTPYGYSGPVGIGECPDLCQQWATFAQAAGYVCGYLGLNPLFEKQGYSCAAGTQPHNSIYVLDLTRTEAELFENLSAGRKGQLRHGDEFQNRLILDRSVLKQFFWDHYHEFFRSRGVTQAFRFFTHETLESLCEFENVILVGAGCAGAVEAVCVTGYTDFAADYLFNVSLPEGRCHTANLLWWTILRLKQLKIPKLNLGGGAREGDGIAAFKKRFGACKMPLRALKQIYQPQKFRELCEYAGVPHDQGTGYFPPYRSPGVQENLK